MHTRHKHTKSACRNTHTSHTRAPTAPRVTIQTENTTSITPLTQTYFNTTRLKKTIFNNGRYTTNMRHIHTSIVSRHLATRDNDEILRTPLPHIISSEERLPRLVAPLPNS